MVTSETRNLQLEFSCADGKKMSFSLLDPKTDLKKADVDTAAQTVIAQNVFMNTDKAELVALHAARIVSKTVESIDA